MLITPHAITGVAIAENVSNPFLVIFLSLIFHFISDKIYHWQETLFPYRANKVTYIRLFFDILLASVILTLLNVDLTEPIILTAILFSLLPDFDSFLNFRGNEIKNIFLKKYYDWHCGIQNETSSFKGLIPQIIIVIAAVYLIISSK